MSTDATTPEPRTAAGRALPCTFHRRNEPVCGEPEDNRTVHSAEDEKMRHGTHIFRHEAKDRFRLPVEVGVCSICGDDEPFHVHNEGERIEDYFTVGRGQTDFQAAQAWKRRAIEAQARPAVASEGLRAALLADLTALAHWSPEEWAERGQGGDPIARTINAARDIVEARLA